MNNYRLKNYIRVLAVLLIMMVTISIIPLYDNTAYASSYETVKDSDYTKLTEGKLTKREVQLVLNIMIDFSGKDIVTHTLTSDEINQLGQDPIINQATLDSDFELGYVTYSKGVAKYPLKRVNNCLSFYTDHRFEKNSSGKDEYNDRLWRTDEDTFYYYGPYGSIATGCIIKSAKYNDKKMILKFIQGNDYSGESGINYTAILKKQDNGRYKLDSIYVPGNYKKFKISKLSKVTKGSIDKAEFKAIAGCIIKKYGLRDMDDWFKRKVISRKKINKIGKDYYTVEKILGKALSYKKSSGWYSYNLKSANKLLSFFSKNQIKKNKKWNGNKLKWRTTKTKIKFNKKTKNSYKIKIESAYQNSDNIKIWVNYQHFKKEDGYSYADTEARYVFKLVKQSNGKYKLERIERLYGHKVQ